MSIDFSKIITYKDSPLDEVLSKKSDNKETLLKIRAWEIKESPTDLGYKLIKDWGKMPSNWKLGQVVSAAMDSKGRYYILHRGKKVPGIICFDRESGKVVNSWGKDEFVFAHAIECDKKDNIWMVDSGPPLWSSIYKGVDLAHSEAKLMKDGGHILYLYSPDGRVIKTLGTKGMWGEDGEHFRAPTDIAWGLRDEFFISDGYVNHRIARYDKKLKFIAQWGSEGEGKGQFTLPHAVTIDDKGLIYVCDRTKWRVEIFSPEGTFLRQWTHIGKACDLKFMPEGYFLMVDSDNKRVTKLDRSGSVIGFFDTIKGAHGFGVAPNADIITCHMDGTFQLFSLR